MSNFLEPITDGRNPGRSWTVRLDQLPEIDGLAQPAGEYGGRYRRSVDLYLASSGDLGRKLEALIREAEGIAAPARALATLRRCHAEVEAARAQASAIFMETEWAPDRELLVVAKDPRSKTWVS